MTTIVDVEYRVIEPPNERGWYFAGLALVAAWLLYAAPWLFQGLVIPWDAKDFYYPMLRFLAASLAQGDPGTWNPYLYSGFPAVADPQSWFFTPTFRLFAANNSAPSMTAMDGMELFHLLLGAAGLLLFCRRIGLRPLAAMIACLVFMFGGVASSRLQHTLMIVSYAYLPWALLLLTIACESPLRWRRLTTAAVFGLVAGFMAANRDQVAFLNCLLLIGVALWHIARRIWPQPSRALRTALELAPALVTGLLVLAIPMLLTLDFLAMSTRPEIDYTTAGYASLQPASFLTLLHANFFGAFESSSYWGPGELPWMSLSALGYDWTDRTVGYLYIGMVPLALLAVAFAVRKPSDPYRRLFIGIFIVSLLYAIGAYTPVFEVIYRVVPGVDLYRRPNDAAFLVNFALAMLVGFAAQAALDVEDEAARLSKLKLVIPLLGLIGAGLAALWIGAYFDHAQDAARAVIIAVPLLLIIGGVIAWGRRRIPLRYFAAALIGFTAADLIWTNAGNALNGHSAGSITAYRPDNIALATEIRARLGSLPNPGRAAIFGLGGSWQNAPIVYQIEQTLGYNPMRWQTYETIVGSQQNTHTNERHLTESFTGYDSAVARALGIRLVVTGVPLDTILPADAYRSLNLIGPRGDAFIYENTAVSPRAEVAALNSPQDVELDAGHELTVTEPSLGGETIGKAEIVSYRPSQVMIAAQLDKPGILVLHDMYHPAWTAMANGQSLPVLRVNKLFRGVVLPAGQHSVQFSFEPLRWSELVEAAGRVMAAHTNR